MTESVQFLDELRHTGRQGLVSLDAGDLCQAETYFLQALAMAESAGEDGYRCDALGSLGLVLSARGDPAGAMRRLSEALAIARRLDDRPRQLVQLGSIGHTYLQIANVEEAIKAYARAAQLARQLGDRQAQAGYLNNLGVLYHNMGGHAQVIEIFEQVLPLAEALGDERLRSTALLHLAQAHAAHGIQDSGENRLALAYARQGLAALADQPESPLHTPMLDVLIESLIQVTAIDEAAQVLLAGLEQARLAHNPGRELKLLGQLADVYFQLDRLEQSVLLYEQALELAVRLQKKLLEGRLAARLAAVQAELGALECSNRSLDRSIQLAQEEKDWQTLAESYFLRALNRQQAGQAGEVIEDCCQAREFFARIGLQAQVEEVEKFLYENTQASL